MPQERGICAHRVTDRIRIIQEHWSEFGVAQFCSVLEDQPETFLKSIGTVVLFQEPVSREPSLNWQPRIGSSS